MSGLAGPAPPRLAGRTGPGEFGPGSLGMEGPAGKSWSGRQMKLTFSHIYCCLLFFEQRISVLTVMYILWLSPFCMFSFQQRMESVEIEIAKGKNSKVRIHFQKITQMVCAPWTQTKDSLSHLPLSALRNASTLLRFVMIIALVNLFYAKSPVWKVYPNNTTLG